MDQGGCEGWSSPPQWEGGQEVLVAESHLAQDEEGPWEAGMAEH